jgi:hypothetical protein
MSSILDMRVALHEGHIERGAESEPYWRGSLYEFWAVNQDAYLWGEIKSLADVLGCCGRILIGGGAAQEFTLTRDEQR